MVSEREKVTPKDDSTEPVDPMTEYRSLAVIKAVQFLSEPIPDVVCYGFGPVGSSGYYCGQEQAHVHSKAVGGLTMLKDSDWIVPDTGGPFFVYSDSTFRSLYEVPAPTRRLIGRDKPEQLPAGKPELPAKPEQLPGRR